MLLWIAFALLTAAALAWVLAPLARPTPAGDAPTSPEASAEAGARAVYRDQLAEIEAEREAGLIRAAEADAARIEISRRLLASAAQPEDATPGIPAPRRATQHGRIAMATAAAVPLLTLALYLAYGSPGMPGTLASQGAAARDQAQIARMMAQVEARLREAPDDSKGWEVIAPVYLKLGRYADAATAYATAVRLQGESVKLLAGLAEASILAKDGIVTEEARTAYERVLVLEPGRVEPRFWLAMGKEQDGRLAEALADYTALLNKAPPDAAYREALEARMKEVSARIAAGGGQERGKKAAEVSAGPTAADMEAAAKLSPEQRQQMIVGMVEGLAQRLKRDGKDLAGWQRLLRAYAVLGRHDDARAALAEARRNFDGDQRALSDLSGLAATLGLGS